MRRPMHCSRPTRECFTFERRLCRRNDSWGEDSEGGRSPPPREVGALGRTLNVQEVRLACGLRAPPRSWTLLIALGRPFSRRASSQDRARARGASAVDIDTKGEAMSGTITRRSFLVGTALATAAPAFAQPKPVKIGLLTVKTGPLAQGGIQMEQGITRFLKDRNNALAGRKVELISADTGGS